METRKDIPKVLSPPTISPSPPMTSSAMTRNFRLKNRLARNKNGLKLKKKSLDTSFKSPDSKESVVRKTVYAVTNRRPYRTRNAQPNTPASSDTNSVVGKFVLPTRSLHSSRVIKPNKKFLNNEQIVTKNGDCVKTVFKRIIPSARLRQRDSDVKTKKSKLPEPKLKPQEPAATEQTPPSPQCISYEHNSSDTLIIDSINRSSSSWSCGKLVLRKARLQLHTQTSDTGDGPFSSYSSSTINPPGTVTCGVCGAVRFYRFVKQARKFNIYSCESCRKFISKMIKRQSSKNLNTPLLVCHKGQGENL